MVEELLEYNEAGIWIFFGFLAGLLALVSWWLTELDLTPNRSNPTWWQVSQTTSFSRLVLPPTFKIKERDFQPRLTWRFHGSKANTEKNSTELSGDALPQKRRFFNSGKWSSKRQRESIPLLCFINSKSGGKQGHALKRLFRHYLNPVQIRDLSECGAYLKDLLDEYMRYIPNLRILCCGGDGTANWILSSIDEVRAAKDFNADSYLTDRPPVAILPLGTGNDLSRVLGWGGGYAGGSIRDILQDVTKSFPVFLDRWNVTLAPETQASSYFPSKKKGAAKPQIVFSNYWGIGVDAQATWSFHNLREARPEFFISRLGNKIWYAILGGRVALRQDCKDLKDRILVEADGEIIELPEGTEGIVFMNISSYAAGTKLWTDPSDEKDLLEFVDDDDDDDDDITYRLDRIPSLDESPEKTAPPSPRQRKSVMTCVNESTMMSVGPAESEKNGEVHPSALLRGSMQDGKVDILCLKGNHFILVHMFQCMFHNYSLYT